MLELDVVTGFLLIVVKIRLDLCVDVESSNLIVVVNFKVEGVSEFELDVEDLTTEGVVKGTKVLDIEVLTESVCCVVSFEVLVVISEAFLVESKVLVEVIDSLDVETLFLLIVV